MKGLFITGTDTGVGKTVVTATLCRILRGRGIDAVALKPFATGIGPDTDWRENDPLLLSAAMDYAEPVESIAPLRLPMPLSPYDAARLADISIDMDAIIGTIRDVAGRHEYALIEGVGGVCVPLTERESVVDFARLVDLPALVVARSSIGTINHSILTINALRQAGIHVEGLAFMRSQDGELSLDEKIGPDTACRLGKATCFGLIEHSRILAGANSVDEAAAALPVNDLTMQAMAGHLMAAVV